LPMAFRAVNTRRHTGLQQLSSLALSGRTLLGPMKSCKFVVDESTNESTLICSAVRLIESLDLSSAAGQLLNETIQAHNKEFKTGTSTLLFLIGAWSSAVVECLQQNIPVSAIVSVMSEGLNSCCEKVQCLQTSIPKVNKMLRSSSVRLNDFKSKTFPTGHDSCLLNPCICLHLEKNISVPEVIPVNSSSPQEDDSNFTECLVSPLAGFASVASLTKPVGDQSTSVISESSVPTSSSNKRRLTHSRYFSTLRHFSSEKAIASSLQGNFQGYLSGQSAVPHECDSLGHLAAALSHGNQSSVKLIQSIVAYQQEGAECSGSFQFNIADIVTCRLLGLPESYSCVSPGLVTLVSPEKATVIKHFEEKSLRILLMDGDLTEQYRHLGFNRLSNLRTILEHPDLGEDRAGASWLSSTLNILKKFEVNLVLVRGNVCEHLMERCVANRILVIGSVAQEVLCAFGKATNTQPVTYLTQVNPSCVGSGAQAELWKACDGRATDLSELVPVRIKVRGSTLLTAVLTTTVASKMQVIEDQFWTSVYRLHHALNDAKVFLGGGAVELLCLSHIQMLTEQPLQTTNKSAVKEFHSPWLTASATEYRTAVLQALASGWKQYLTVVMCNAAVAVSELEARTSIDRHLKKAADSGSPSAYVLKELGRGDLLGGGSSSSTDHSKGLSTCDNVTAKTEAWRRALDLVLLVLQTDAEIITGPKRNHLLNSQASSEFMFL
ncbi:BBS12 protein, partial [Upupa epops]|nr:BBS12 protein [Upupa epops]